MLLALFDIAGWMGRLAGDPDRNTGPLQAIVEQLPVMLCLALYFVMLGGACGALLGIVWLWLLPDSALGDAARPTR